MEEKNKRGISLTTFILTLLIMFLACCLLIYLISTNKIGNKTSDSNLEIKTTDLNNEVNTETEKIDEALLHKEYKDKIDYLFGINNVLIAFFDIDKNGIPELIVETGSYEAEKIGFFFTFKNGEVISLGNIPMGHAGLYEMYNQQYIMKVWGHMGYETIYNIYIENDKIIEKMISQREFETEFDAYTEGDKGIIFETREEYEKQFINEEKESKQNANIQTIKPSSRISKLFANYSEAEEYITSSWGKSSTIELYENEIPVGDAVWFGLVSDYKASSTYNKDKIDYNVNNLGDLFVDKCWCEGISGNGVGQTIEINTFGSCEKVEWESRQRSMKSIDDMIDYLRENENNISNFYSKIDQIAIINGYAKGDDLWRNNSRVKKLKLTIDNNIEYIFELEDSKDVQLFDINYKNNDITKKINLKFEILEVYNGDKYDDTCITSLYLVGGSNIEWGGR